MKKKNQERNISYLDLFRAFLMLGLTAFGGPAMIPYIQEEAVEKRQWLSREQFSTGIGISQIIPGATAMQMAAYVGLNVKGIPGALICYLGFAIPAFIIVVGLSYLYVEYNDVRIITTVFESFKIIVVALILKATIKFYKSYINELKSVMLGLLSFIWLFAGLNPIQILVAVCILAVLVYKNENNNKKNSNIEMRSNSIIYIISIILLLIALIVVVNTELKELAMVFSKVDLFAFGGGYVSVPLMFHEVVDVHQWLSTKEFMDGIAFGQITPGPIVMTATFVGYMIQGLLGAIIGTIYVFAPSFILICMVSIYGQKILGNKWMKKALKGSLVCLVGLLAAVCLNFIESIDWTIKDILICGVAFYLLHKISIIKVVSLGIVFTVSIHIIM